MHNIPEVTVIIPNYNGRQLLQNCIRSLEAQTYKKFKVLVIDNGSTDGSAEVTSEELDIEVVKLGENTGFCGAVNEGVRRAATPYVILLNNDTEPETSFVGELLKAIKKSRRIFSCNAMMIDYRKRDRLDNAGDLYTALGWAYARGKGKSLSSCDKAVSIFSSCGGASIYRLDVIRELGGLDEQHFAYLEDVDLGYRARIRGFVNRYEPRARVYHVGSATTGTRYNEKKVYLAARNSIFLIYKNMPLIQLIINLPFILAGVLVKWIFFAKKKLGREYLRGIAAGINECAKCKKVPFMPKYTANYVRIQLELWVNIVRLLANIG
jgi:GT2 family glycosyltransferase